jgi:DNA-binding transcriptional ArsR family regulator
VEIKEAVSVLGALAQETRLSIYRLLVEAGRDGESVGRIGEMLKVPGATLSFHLKELARAGLVTTRQERQIYLLCRGLRTHGGAHDFSHAELLSRNAGEVSDDCRNGTRQLLRSGEVPIKN